MNKNANWIETCVRTYDKDSMYLEKKLLNLLIGEKNYK